MPDRCSRPLAGSLALALALASGLPAGAEPGHVFAPLTDADRQAIRAALPTHARAHPVRPRRVLIFYRTQGYVHACIPFANEALSELGTATGAYTADVREDPQALSPARIAHYDAVVFNNTTHLSLSPEERASLLAFVRTGGGLVGIHAASDSFYAWPDGQTLIGGIFNSHPWTANDVVAVKLNDPSSPLTAAFGGHGFWVKDEIYQVTGPYSRERVHELLSLDMARPENARKPEDIVRDDNDFPIAWIHREGRGRVFYTSLGHNPEDYRTPQLLQHYLDGIQYAVGDLRADATPSARLTPAPPPAPAPASPAVILNESR